MKIKIGKLKIDTELTRLRPINGVFVSRYRQAYRTGANMPLITIEAKTKKVISGNHRLTALLQEYGKNHEIDVIAKNYSSRREMLVEFVHENTSHGNALDGISRRRLSHALLQEGMTTEEVAQLFNVSVQRVEQWEDFKVIVQDHGNQTTEFVKAGFKPKSGVISKSEYQTHIKADRGLSVYAQAAQLTRWLDGGHIELSKENVQALNALNLALNRFLTSLKKKKVS